MQRAAVDRQLGRGRAQGHASDVEAAQGNDKDSRQRRTARVQPQRAFIACVCGLLVPAGMLGCEAYDVLRESSRIGIRARALARGVEVAPSGHKSQSALYDLYDLYDPAAFMAHAHAYPLAPARGERPSAHEPELVAATSTIVVGRPAPAPQRSPTAYVTDPVEVLATPPELPTGAACEGAAQPARPLAHEVEWRLPVGCDMSGFFSEVVLGFIPALAPALGGYPGLLAGMDDLWPSVPPPDRHANRLRLLTATCEPSFLSSQMTPCEAAAYRAAHCDDACERGRAETGATRASIVIEHGDPCAIRAWPAADRVRLRPSAPACECMLHPPLRPCERMLAVSSASADSPRTSLACPSQPRRVIARAMSEGSLGPAQAQCVRAAADEVWVPTEWHRRAFAAAGVAPVMIHVVPEPVDTVFFAPRAEGEGAGSDRGGGGSGDGGGGGGELAGRRPFTFLSVFKWEARKGCAKRHVNRGVLAMITSTSTPVSMSMSTSMSISCAT